ncbi:MFS family permease [Azospirillum agricola]|uniref:MFS transporter n=1 Tax=Azospirillum agricola TaxID=1720247 RepID=UPI001AE3950E|nr:MFS transporter [Azospirillum agricola]MBP2232714.1 MFS family permease [Azospirillum agricola]
MSTSASTSAAKRLLYAENFLITFAVGIFLTLPTYLQQQGRTEIFFGQVFAVGAVGALTCVVAVHWLLRRFGLNRVAPWGSLAFGLGSVVYALAAQRFADSDALFYAASLLQGVGWGLFLPIGPICVSSMVEAKERPRFFALYGAFNTLGIGVAPIVSSLAMTHLHASFLDLFVLACVANLGGWLCSWTAARGNESYAAVSREVSVNTDRNAILQVFALPSVYFFAMMLLCGCLYTSMTNFQTSFAGAMGLDYKLFFLFFTSSIILARFSLGRLLSDVPPRRSMPALVAVMLVAMACLYGAALSSVFYAAAAVLFGLSYGLIVPMIQAQATAHAPDALRSQVLITVSMSYLLARYLFPYFAAQAIQPFGYGGLLFLLVLCAALNVALAGYFFFGRVVYRAA